MKSMCLAAVFAALCAGSGEIWAEGSDRVLSTVSVASILDVTVPGSAEATHSDGLCGGCTVVDGGVAYVEGFGPIEDFDVWLSSRSHLDELNLICVELSDADVEAILRLPVLKTLSLRGCQMSSSHVESLAASVSIRRFELHDVFTRVNDVRQLRNASIVVADR